MTKDYHRKDGNCFEGKGPIDFVTRTEATGVSRLSSGDFLEPKSAKIPTHNTKTRETSELTWNVKWA